jgi:hypothetical protein
MLVAEGHCRDTTVVPRVSTTRTLLHTLLHALYYTQPTREQGVKCSAFLVTKTIFLHFSISSTLEVAPSRK